MAGFARVQGALTVDGVSLAGIARSYGTPCHLYSQALLTERFRGLDAAFARLPHAIHYALKANSTLALVRHLRSLGARADANSGGEIDVALVAGFTPAEIVFTGVGKTREEIRRAVTLGVAAINAESFGEVDRIAAIAAAEGRVARVALRINPGVDAGSHRHISTGDHRTKFGVSVDEARLMIASVRRHDSLRLVGLHVHVGSQITTLEPLVRGVRVVTTFATELRAQGVDLSHLDVGGGLGIAYQPGQAVVTPDDWAHALAPIVGPTGLTLVLEPGRWIVGPAGVLLTEVVDIKTRPEGGTFVIVDAGMTDLMRPALYEAWHEIEPVSLRTGPATLVDIVGPVCETTDTFASARALPPVEVGDWLVIRDTGAYGSVMASNYNRRPLAAEILVTADGATEIVRRRQTIDEMLQWER